MKSYRAPILAPIIALGLAALLAGCGSWEYKQEINILKSDPNGIVIRAGSDTNPDRMATIYCQASHKLMVPRGADIIDQYQKVYYYACL
jgi:hypothetical protein